MPHFFPSNVDELWLKPSKVTCINQNQPLHIEADLGLNTCLDSVTVRTGVQDDGPRVGWQGIDWRNSPYTCIPDSKVMMIGVSILYTNILILSGWELETRYRIQTHVHHTISPKAPFDPFVFEGLFSRNLPSLVWIFNYTSSTRWYC